MVHSSSPSERKSARPFRRLHNFSLFLFLCVAFFIVLVPLPKQLSLSKVTQSNSKFTLKSLSTSAPSLSSVSTSVPSFQTTTNTSAVNIIHQLNNDRLIEQNAADRTLHMHIVSESSQTVSNTSILSNETSPVSVTTLKNASMKEEKPEQIPTVSNKVNAISKTEIEIEQLLNENSHLLANPKTNSSYIIFRAIGNDLPPRHALGQSYNNVKFILDHEQKLPDLDVRWYVNRIFDDDERLRILQLLVHHKQLFFVDEFNLTDYARTDFRLREYFGYADVLRSKISKKGLSLTDFKFIRAWDMIFEPKNHYIVHNNQARNAMISLGREAGATYVLPWDGNCFLNLKAWTNITNTITGLTNSTNANEVSTRYFYVPMARMKNDEGNDALKNPDYVPKNMPDEPQLIFHRDANTTFDEAKPYGYRPKVDLLWRLRIPEFQFRDRTGRILNKTMTWKYVTDIPGFDSVRPVGWTARLFSGSRSLEGADANTAIARGWSRSDGVEMLAARASLRYAERHLNYSRESTTLLFNRSKLELLSPEDRSFSMVTKQSDAALVTSPLTEMPLASFAKHAVAVGIADLVKSSDVAISSKNTTVTALLKWFSKTKPESVLQTSEVEDLMHMCSLIEAARLLRVTSASKIVADWAVGMSDVMTRSIQNNAPNEKERMVTVNLTAKWLPIYYSQTRDAVLFETAAACIAAATPTDPKTDRFHIALRHTSLARLRLHDLLERKGNPTNQTFVEREGVKGLVPWILLAGVGERIGVDIWRHTSPNDKRRSSGQTPFLVNAISEALSIMDEKLNGDDGKDGKLVAWLRAMVRRKYGRALSADARVLNIEEIEDNKIFEETMSEDIDTAIPPFFDLGV